MQSKKQFVFEKFFLLYNSCLATPKGKILKFHFDFESSTMKVFSSISLSQFLPSNSQCFDSRDNVPPSIQCGMIPNWFNISKSKD